MKRAVLARGLFAVLGAFLLASSGLSAVSAVPMPTVQPLAFTVPSNLGAVQNLGAQTYAVSGGRVASAAIGGRALDPGATVTFSLNAVVGTSSIAGVTSFELHGTISGIPVSAMGVAAITSSLPVSQTDQASACIGAGAKACGQLPVFFSGASKIAITVLGLQKVDTTVLNFENPYFNPFGAPIVLASSDGAVVIAATYDVGTIVWQGTMVGGPLVGVLGASTPVTGVLGLTSTEHEDLVAGTAVDNGTFTLGSMTPAFLGMTGVYSGTSSIPPPAPGSDCSKLFGFPSGSGVCTMTGFNSSGRYVMMQGGVSIVGRYSTVWTVPALAFTSTSAAIVVR